MKKYIIILLCFSLLIFSSCDATSNNNNKQETNLNEILIDSSNFNEYFTLDISYDQMITEDKSVDLNNIVDTGGMIYNYNTTCIMTVKSLPKTELKNSTVQITIKVPLKEWKSHFSKFNDDNDAYNYYVDHPDLQESMRNIISPDYIEIPLTLPSTSFEKKIELTYYSNVTIPKGSPEEYRYSFVSVSGYIRK